MTQETYKNQGGFKFERVSNRINQEGLLRQFCLMLVVVVRIDI